MDKSFPERREMKSVRYLEKKKKIRRRREAFCIINERVENAAVQSHASHGGRSIYRRRREPRETTHVETLDTARLLARVARLFARMWLPLPLACGSLTWPSYRVIKAARPAAVVPETPRRAFLLCRWCSPDGDGCVRFFAAHSASRAIVIAPRGGTWLAYLWSSYDLLTSSRIRPTIFIGTPRELQEFV